MGESILCHINYYQAHASISNEKMGKWYNSYRTVIGNLLVCDTLTIGYEVWGDIYVKIFIDGR